MPEPTDNRANVRRLVSAMYLSGAITVVAGIALGFVISPILFVAVALGIVDFVIGGLFASGRIGPLAAERKAAASGEAGVIAEADPSFNPYARED
jgi:hypothetical protein